MAERAQRAGHRLRLLVEFLALIQRKCLRGLAGGRVVACKRTLRRVKCRCLGETELFGLDRFCPTRYCKILTIKLLEHDT